MFVNVINVKVIPKFINTYMKCAQFSNPHENDSEIKKNILIANY